ncbi:MAG: cytochrome C biogenesis protein [Persephonella sp.]|nr:MAG: cytochrome C biogenesis protein [Persephonella sp.]RUM59760.1 MAG: cytochrome C biogenesis protein [Persephonella sp.]
METDISVFMAFLGGVLAFLSPCVLPIIPGYIAYISGLSVSSVEEEEKRKINFNILFSALAFVLGFSIVFTLLGAGSTFIGQLLFKYKILISQIAGILVILLGIHFTNIFQHKKIKEILGIITLILIGIYIYGYVKSGSILNDYWVFLGLAVALNLFYYSKIYMLLYQQKTTEIKNKPSGIIGAFIIGVAFAFGWSPCIGPILGAILLYASQQETVYQGMLLLFSFSMGLGIPFIITALTIDLFVNFTRKFSRYFFYVELAGGILLILIGILLITGNMSRISSFLSF